MSDESVQELKILKLVHFPFLRHLYVFEFCCPYFSTTPCLLRESMREICTYTADFI